MALGEFKHLPKHLKRAAAKNSGQRPRKVGIEARVARYSEGTHGSARSYYVAEVCVRRQRQGRARAGRKLGGNCQHGIGPSPTRAIGFAMERLSAKLRAGAKR